ncbi:helix-turn-helix domain-containing protein [Dolichospermum sp. FACHB-1091]|uniref:helix-turn-helix domain-containing protein n=1 Tax=Dolichospermum sp. FACHB-1091 TaxID=2692798 RepID=UPI001680D636|nr:RodZ domain-containing protein [Dolichospermum sp. FACHB-1091]MBD2445385.1 helix-turn-helix domain-containing protein [Dolichospermum sp. FACHB-1091]
MKWFRKKDEQPMKPSIKQHQSEKLTQLGSQLASLRQEKDLTLDELVLLTRIPRRLLRAIEEGNLNDLPEPIYIQGLIRQFAAALGLQGGEFASHFPIGHQSVGVRSSWKGQSILQLRPIHLYLLYIILIFSSVNSLSQLLNNPTLQANNRQIQPGKEPQSAEQKTSANKSSISKQDQSVQVGVTLKASSWISVVTDGKTAFEGVLPRGYSRTWKANQQLTVKTDNAGGVLMSVNRQEAKEMGEIGKTEEIQIAAQPN